jgi:SNF2 family DNA or RNA helicase
MSKFIFHEFTISSWSSVFILKHSASSVDTGKKDFYNLQPEEIERDNALFLVPSITSEIFQVSVVKVEEALILVCSCNQPLSNLCEHQSQVLFNLMSRDELRIFFDERLRWDKIKQAAKDYGLEEEANPDEHFEVKLGAKSIEIKPKNKDLLPLNNESGQYFKDHLLPVSSSLALQKLQSGNATQRIIVFREHKYYKHFYIELYEAVASSKGKIKNPLVLIDPMDFIWKLEDPIELKFYTAILKFKNTYESERADSDLEGLKALVKNPLGLPAYFHDPKVSVNINANALVAVKLELLKLDIRLTVNLKDSFYEIFGKLYLNDKGHDLELLQLKYSYFLLFNGCMYLIYNPDFLKVIAFFKEHNNRVLVHQNKYQVFKEQVLSKLEDKIQIIYSYLKPATARQLKERNFDLENEKLIYLSDLGDYVLLTPVVRYGDVEVPILSSRQIHAIDSRGVSFRVHRDEEMELQFISTLSRQHPTFMEQLNQDHFYLHRKHFIDEQWFLDIFEYWKAQGVAILGFNQLKGNNLNSNRAKITIEVISGLNWFDTNIDVRFADQKVSLKHLHKSLRNKSNFVQLGDGTIGILPKEWMEKFSNYFNGAEVTEDSLRTPKSNFAAVSALYEKEILSQEVRLELSRYQDKIQDFKNIKALHVPEALQGTLRDYQKEGLNWLNFLDEFGFGGCLADDMGLGKTVQIIAFILDQKEKGHEASLIVVPTTLIFNWQAELLKFAPSLRVYTIYGAERIKHTRDFGNYDVILTSYGTLLYDINYLKKHVFNYVFLDESQTIKNPMSQRHQAAALLKSRSKIVLTGTPVENNTFDLFGQLSLAVPGLLGNKQFFRDHYSSPIDRFKDSKRAVELQKKVSPFILRRTKKQVAKELPDKTEMVIYCEMGEEQQRVYDSYKKEYKSFLESKKGEDLSRYSMHILKGLTILRQICDSPALLKDETYYGDSSAKIDFLMEEIEQRSGQHKILIFSQFVKMLNLIKTQLEKRSVPFEYLTGQTIDREKRVNNFQESPGVRVFLISLKAGGMGLNLTEADYVYLVDPWWNPAVENQAIDRSYRIGQNKNVVAIRLITPGTIEEKIMKLQETKRDLVDDLIKTDANILKQLSQQDLMELFN